MTRRNYNNKSKPISFSYDAKIKWLTFLIKNPVSYEAGLRASFSKYHPMYKDLVNLLSNIYKRNRVEVLKEQLKVVLLEKQLEEK